MAAARTDPGTAECIDPSAQPYALYGIFFRDFQIPMFAVVLLCEVEFFSPFGIVSVVRIRLCGFRARCTFFPDESQFVQPLFPFRQ